MIEDKLVEAKDRNAKLPHSQTLVFIIHAIVRRTSHEPKENSWPHIGTVSRLHDSTLYDYTQTVIRARDKLT